MQILILNVILTLTNIFQNILELIEYVGQKYLHFYYCKTFQKKVTKMFPKMHAGFYSAMQIQNKYVILTLINIFQNILDLTEYLCQKHLHFCYCKNFQKKVTLMLPKIHAGFYSAV